METEKKETVKTVNERFKTMSEEDVIRYADIGLWCSSYGLDPEAEERNEIDNRRKELSDYAKEMGYDV